ncbi:heterokaryon incompatibility protein-domain-containing protein [Phaeosphaeria sp. MPI-PUGE-AT-0046c]|nr:heterokaryon incompatibility protein-domain-containing protein [Phaeosphaeria sp. MPI-PUGE-AT-0046c]
MESLANSTGNGTVQYRHTLLDQDRSSIRLVEILPYDTTGSSIQCRISHHMLPLGSEKEKQSIGSGKRPRANHGNDLPSYRCLSYAWGDTQDPLAISLNGEMFWVGQNLHAFLSIARQTLYNTYLWIDALCIDQSSTSERNHQVQQMGRIYSNAESVLVWLGDDPTVTRVLQRVNESAIESRSDEYADLRRHVPFWMSRPIIDFELRSLGARPIDPTINSWRTSHYPNVLDDTTGKAEKLFEPFIVHNYWSRAWVTQEILLAQRTVVLAGVEAHGLIALAMIYRSAVQYHGDSAFESIIDVIFRKEDRVIEHNPFGQGLENWGLVNLLHRFRHKECAIRRDRVYSLLALAEEAAALNVDYNIPEEQVLRQVLNLRESSICLCSVATVAQALGPWEVDNFKNDTDKPFARMHMYALALGPTGCLFCSNWMPSSWKKKKGRIFCLGTACPDTQGHIFWEYIEQGAEPDNVNPDSGKKESTDLIHLQLRRNNKSQLLCQEGMGISITRSEWRDIYILQFTLHTLIELLLHNPEAGDMGLNACGNLWPSQANRGTAGEGRLRLCDEK